MKIRTVIMLIAGSALALPEIATSQDVAPRIEVAYYYWQWLQEGAEPCSGLAPYAYHDEVSYTPTLISRTGHFLRDCEWWPSGGWTETWPGPGMPGEGDYPPVFDQPIEPFSREIPWPY